MCLLDDACSRKLLRKVVKKRVDTGSELWEMKGSLDFNEFPAQNAEIASLLLMR